MPTHQPHQLIAEVQHHGYRHLIFDLDQTLAHLHLPWAEWVRQVSAISPRISQAEFESNLAHPDAVSGKVQNQLLHRHPELYDRYITITTDFETKYFSYTPNHPLIAALPRLAAVADLSLWTSNVRATVDRTLSELDLTDTFARIATREDVFYGKPDPEGWRQLALRGEPLSSYLFIGDSPNDQLAAQAIGIRYYHIDLFK